MNVLLKFAVSLAAALALASCGGDTGSADKPNLEQASSKRSAQQAQPASAYHNVVQTIYVGYFGRPADPSGLAFFAGRLSTLNAPTDIQGVTLAYASNADVKALIDVFGTSQESADLYPGDNSSFMDAVYRNLFSRAADAGGKAFWVEQLNLGNITRANAAVSVISGAQGSDITVINNKAAVAANFTTSLATPLQLAAYSGLEANAVVRNMLATVLASTDVNAFQATINATLGSLINIMSPAGMYLGTLGTGNSVHNSLILENGQYWGFYTQQTSGRLRPSGLLQGTGSSSNGEFVSSDIRDFNPIPYNPGSIAATFLPQTSLAGTIVTPFAAIGFTSTGVPAATYQYNVPASLDEIAGAWTLSDVDGHVYSMAGISNGATTATASACSFGATFEPRASGKNVFNVALAYSTGACRMSGQTPGGVAFSYLADEGATRQLFIAVTSADRSLGTVMHGNRVTAAGMAPALTMTDTVIGSGATVGSGNIVSVHYTGWLYSATAPNQRSTKFDSSLERGTPFSFTLGVGQVIQGWDQGVAGMRVGGKRILVIPASMGYGAAGSAPTILPNASLVFEVEVLSVR